MRLGTALRTLRIRAGWTQAELAIRAGVSDSDVSRLERGLADRMSMLKVHAIALALDAWADFGLRWRGGELDRVVGARHAALHQALARWLADVGGWELAPEVSFSVYGERGVIDGLAWHAATRTLLVIELKSELVDVSELLGTFDRKLRLAPGIARDRGWDAARVAGWLLVADGRTNRRRAAAHRDVLRAALPDDGRRLEGWLRAPVSPRGGTPSAPLRAMSFLPDRHLAGLSLRLAPPKRVRPRRSCVGAGSRNASPASDASLAGSGPGQGD
jgi:transcriptional regulator with XRE-family HTH domain